LKVTRISRRTATEIYDYGYLIAIYACRIIFWPEDISLAFWGTFLHLYYKKLPITKPGICFE